MITSSDVPNRQPGSPRRHSRGDSARRVMKKVSRLPSTSAGGRLFRSDSDSGSGPEFRGAVLYLDGRAHQRDGAAVLVVGVALDLVVAEGLDGPAREVYAVGVADDAAVGYARYRGEGLEAVRVELHEGGVYLQPEGAGADGDAVLVEAEVRVGHLRRAVVPRGEPGEGGVLAVHVVERDGDG